MKRPNKTLIVMFVVFFICVVAFVFSLSNLLGKVASNGGLQPIVESLWCGSPGCMGQKK